MPQTHDVVLKMLHQALENEIDTRRFYLDTLQKVDDPKGQEMYRFLADEERQHERIIQMQIDALTGGEGWVAPADLPATPLDDLDTLFRTPREQLRKRVQPDDRDLDALIIALEMEDNSYEVYRQALQETDDPQGQQVLRYLARAEQHHFDLVMQNYEALLYRQHWSGLSGMEGQTP
jgi:rubrerythrin